MFNETETLPKGEFDRTLEEAGAESNASTWLDFTQYNISAPSSQLPLLVKLESDRMHRLVLKQPQLESEIEVVANERRYRVDDDVEGTVNELLWKTAFEKHSYHWPTIGWMEDIVSFTTEDCEAFYRTYYAPNNATVVLVGDFDSAEALSAISQAYGPLKAADLPLEDVHPEPPQLVERHLELTKPTLTEKLTLGYRGPALGDADHIPANLLTEVLFGGRAARIYKKLVRELELATDVRMSVGPFRDPGLIELYATAREGHTAEELLTVIDSELERVRQEPISQPEIERARARFELGLLHGLETADSKAQTIGFYDCVLGKPAAAFERLDALELVTRDDLLRVARRYLDPNTRTKVIVRASGEPPAEGSSEDELEDNEADEFDATEGANA
jgi:zinc protease